MAVVRTQDLLATSFYSRFLPRSVILRINRSAGRTPAAVGTLTGGGWSWTWAAWEWIGSRQA